ncbi:unnamed protein product [Boreogadus saida]
MHLKGWSRWLLFESHEQRLVYSQLIRSRASLRAESSAHWRTQSPVLLRFDTPQGRVIAPWRTQSPVLLRFDTPRPTGGPRALFYCGLTRLRAESSAHWRTQSPVLLRTQSPVLLRFDTPRPTGGPRALFYCGLTRLRAESSAHWRTQSPVLLRTQSPALLRFDTPQGRVIAPWRTQSPVLLRFDTPRPTGGPRALFYCGLTRLRAESSAHWRTQSPVLLRFDTPQGRGPRALFYCGLTRPGPLEDPEPCCTAVRVIAPWRTQSPVLPRFDTPRPTGGPRALLYCGLDQPQHTGEPQSPVLTAVFDNASAHWRTQSPALLRFDTPQPTGGPRALFYRGLTRLGPLEDPEPCSTAV